MIETEVWKQNIYIALHDIADKHFQQRAWFGIGNFVSSPYEDFSHLIDDNDFSIFIEESKMNFSTYQKQQAHHFIKVFNDYYDSLPGDYLDPNKIINDPNWDTIRKEALQLITTLDLNKYKDINKRYQANS